MLDIKATEDKNKVSTPVLSGSGKNVLSFSSLAASALRKSSSGGLADYSSTSWSGGFKFGSSTGGSEFETLPETKIDHVSGAVTGNINLSYKGKKGKNIVIEDL